MLDEWQYAWDKFNELVMEDFCAERISEIEMERRLYNGERTTSAGELLRYASKLKYRIKIPK